MRRIFRPRRRDIARPLSLSSSRTRPMARWVVWGIAMAMLPPAIGFAAYQPGFVQPSRAVNTTAPITGGGDLSVDRTIAISDCTATVRGAVPTPPNNTTTFLRGDCTFAAPGAASPVAPTIYTGTLPVTLANTNGLLEVIEMATPASGVANLPTSPTAGMVICIKDGLKNFAANVLTVKTTDSSTIDKVTGSTGYAMNQNGQANCFQYAASGTNWYIM